jgi:hypothetical protein
MDDDSRYKGVAGWLLLLCVSLTILDPFAILLNLVYVTSTVKPYFERDAALVRLIVVGGVCRIALMLASIYAGISMWKGLPGAPAIARKYFLAVSFYSVFSIFLPAVVGMPEEAYREIAGSAIVNGLVTILYAAAWYLYLIRSKRVRATYTVSG